MLYHKKYDHVIVRDNMTTVCKGFTGTRGAVKPQSSVDVDELRSSKSMDDNSICRKN